MNNCTLHTAHCTLFKRIVSTALALAVIFALFSVPSSAVAGEVTFASAAGIRYVAKDRRDGYSDAFLLDAGANCLQYEYLDGLMDSALDAVASRKSAGLKYLLVPGGLSYNGEELNHTALAERLELFENDTGIEVIVCNGPGDIMNTKGARFEGGKKTADYGMTITSVFKTVYAEFGWDIAHTAYNGSRRDTSGSLSYSVRLEGGYRLIVMDAASYDAMSISYGGGDSKVHGRLTDAVLAWAAGQCSAAKAAGEIPIGMCGWSFVDPTGISEGVLENAGDAAETLANAGMKYVFTGGTGRNDIGSVVTDGGLTLYDVQTAPLVSFPNTVRINSLEGDKGSFTLVDCDETRAVVSRTGAVMPKPYRETTSLRVQFPEFDLARFVTDIVRNYLSNELVPALNNSSTNTITKYLRLKRGIDVEALLNGYMGRGINILGTLTFFDASNLMNLLENSIFPQLQDKFLTSPDTIPDILYPNLKRLFEAQITSVPCSKFLDRYGFGEAEGHGTVTDLLLSMYVYSACGNEDISDDEFIKEAVISLESGALVNFLANAVLTVFINDILFDEILSEITMEPTYLAFFDTAEGSLGYYLQYGYQAWAFMHGQDDSVAGFIKALFDITYLRNRLLHGFTSVDDITKWYVDNYFSGDNARDIGSQLAVLIGGFVIDEDPFEKADWDSTITPPSSPVKAEATYANFRLPSLVAMTPGRDESEIYVSWYTASTVKGSDVELYDTENPEFLGAGFIGAKGVKIEAETEEVTRDSVVLDLKLFSLGKRSHNLRHHTVKISGLSDKYYCFRVGDAASGWWSRTLKAGSPDKVTTLVHITDTDSSSRSQYALSSNALDCAEYLHSDIDAIIHTGNIAGGTDIDSWSGFLDAPVLRSNPIVPAAGNNEYRTSALTDNTAIGKLYREIIVNEETGETVPQTGDYYSFNQGNAHIAVLDSGYMSSAGCVSDEQVAWLMTDMGASAARWKIVAVHAPVYTNGVTSQADIYKAYMLTMETVMSELGVDLVLCGNDCVYYRTDGVKNNLVKDTVSDVSYPFDGSYYKTILRPDSTVYTMLGSAGAKSALEHERYDVSGLTGVTGVSVDPDCPMFSIIRINGEDLCLEVYTVNGNKANRVDSVLIKKSGSALALGDVNGDGKITAEDARLALRCSAKLEKLNDVAYEAADADKNGDVTAADARKILRVSAKLESFD